MGQLPFEYCALRFLFQWMQAEADLHVKMKGTPSPDDVRESLRRFGVARSFKGLNEDRKASFITTSLRRVARDDTLTMKEKVASLARELKHEFHTFNLSASSKLLWLTYRSPFLIYDSRAVKALHELKCQFTDTRDYTEFCKHWKSRYKQYRVEIGKASARLITIRSWLPDRFGSRDELSKLLGKHWFHERVFDMYLWELGGDRVAPETFPGSRQAAHTI